tara:strand:- start:5487 stop:5720 length:234 start_codon:yes stop_codon:yes gene_type:complete
MVVEFASIRLRQQLVEASLAEPMLDDREFREFVFGMIPVKKLSGLDDVVAAVLYLVSPGAAMGARHSLEVDGGWTAQ